MPLQRNASDHPLDVPAASATVQPGDTLDWPDPVIGFEPADPDPEPSPTKTRKTAATAGEEAPK